MQGGFGRTAGVNGGSGNVKRGSNFGGRSFGNSGDYESAITMNFRGQEKKQLNPGQLGQNPNIDATDDYIINLQQ